MKCTVGSSSQSEVCEVRQKGEAHLDEVQKVELRYGSLSWVQLS